MLAAVCHPWTPLRDVSDSSALETDITVVPRPVTGRAGLSRRSLRVLRAVAEVLFDDGSGPPAGERLDWLIADVDDFVRATAGTTRLGLRVATWLIQMSPLLLRRSWRRFVKLPGDRRLAVLERLESSRFAPLALLFGVVKIILAMLYFEHPGALAETGYDGHCLTGPHPAPGLPSAADAA